MCRVTAKATVNRTRRAITPDMILVRRVRPILAILSFSGLRVTTQGGVRTDQPEPFFTPRLNPTAKAKQLTGAKPGLNLWGGGATRREDDFRAPT